MNFIEKTSIVADHTKMLEDLHFVLEKTKFSDNGQIGLTHRPGSDNPWHDAVGSLYDKKTSTIIARENEFTEWHKDVPAYTKEILIKLSTSFNFTPGRIRYMRLKSKTGLSVHKDLEQRYHYVLDTNEKSYMLLSEQYDGADVRGWHIPLDGHFYKVDTTREHFVYNGGFTDRIHLVICAV